MLEVNERLTTVEDGPQTVNERLSPGGPGPEGQADTATERLSGDQAPAAPEPEPEVEAPVARKAAPRKKS